MGAANSLRKLWYGLFNCTPVMMIGGGLSCRGREFQAPSLTDEPRRRCKNMRRRSREKVLFADWRKASHKSRWKNLDFEEGATEEKNLNSSRE